MHRMERLGIRASRNRAKGGRSVSHACALALAAVRAIVAVSLTGAAAVYGQTTATYTGAAGDGKYGTPGNWDIGVVPANDGTTTYQVIIPDNKQVLYNFGTSTTVDTLTLGGFGSVLTLNTATGLVVNGDVTGNAGTVRLLAGTFNAPGNKPALAYSPNFDVSGGGVVHFGGTNYRMDYQDYRASRTAVSADGAGSLVDLSHATNFSGAAYGWGGQWTYTVQAVNGGVVDLSAVTSITGARTDVGDNDDWLRFTAQNRGTIKLDKLGATAGAVWFDVQVPSFTLPTLQSVAGRGRFDLATGSTVSLPALQAFTGDRSKGVGFNLGTNATVDAPQLASVNYA